MKKPKSEWSCKWNGVGADTQRNFYFIFFFHLFFKLIWLVWCSTSLQYWDLDCSAASKSTKNFPRKRHRRGVCRCLHLGCICGVEYKESEKRKEKGSNGTKREERQESTSKGCYLCCWSILNTCVAQRLNRGFWNPSTTLMHFLSNYISRELWVADIFCRKSWVVLQCNKPKTKYKGKLTIPW